MLMSILRRRQGLKGTAEIMKAILPEESQDEIPVGFSIVGHVG
jgi:hypothetical protein